jgi:hypothetical protein
MVDEQKTVNKTDEKNIPAESSTEEKNPLEVKTEAVNPEKTEISTEEVKTKDEKLTGAEKRIHQLVDERNQAKAEAEDLSAKLSELTSAPADMGYNPANKPANGESQGEERELTIDDLRAVARLEVEKEKTIARINSEAIESQKLHPELDKTNELFDSEVNEAVTTAVWLEIKNNPNLSVKKLTDKYMRPYRKAAEKAVGQEKATLTKQVNEEALRPSNVKVAEKPFAEKSFKEMEEQLGVVY